MKESDRTYWDLFFALAVSYIIGCISGGLSSRGDYYSYPFLAAGLLLGASLLFFCVKVLKSKKVKRK